MNSLEKELLVQSEMQANKVGFIVFIVVMAIMLSLTLMSWSTGVSSANLMLWIFMTPLFSWGAARQARTCIIVSIESKKVINNHLQETKRC